MAVINPAVQRRLWFFEQSKVLQANITCRFRG
ncbi:Uncharacterised protein [Vibrio cholerae]|nr:Uncharacterised protein [Vibrio cholerae]